MKLKNIYCVFAGFNVDGGLLCFEQIENQRASQSEQESNNIPNLRRNPTFRGK